MILSFMSDAERKSVAPSRRATRTALTTALIGGLVFAPTMLGTGAVTAVAALPGAVSAPVGLADQKPPSKLTVTSKQAGGTITLSILVEAVGSTVPAGGVITVMEGGDWLGDVAIVAGRGSKVLPKLPQGEHTLMLNYTGDANTPAAQTWYTLVVTADTSTHVKASSRVKASFTRLSKHRVKAKVTVTTAAKLTGWIEIRDGSKLVAKRTIKSLAGAGTTSTSVKLTTKKLKKGKRKLTIRYLGSPTVKAASKTYTVRVR